MSDHDSLLTWFLQSLTLTDFLLLPQCVYMLLIRTVANTMTHLCSYGCRQKRQEQQQHKQKKNSLDQWICVMQQWLHTAKFHHRASCRAGHYWICDIPVCTVALHLFCLRKGIWSGNRDNFASNEQQRQCLEQSKEERPWFHFLFVF